ncbi:hypothetical protein E4T56_gene14342 [Termitomyces sp. T112]|nr:hypothetical protein E4T56_gene14342 [Termitomyces sp. T112]
MDRISASREASQPLRSKTGGSTFKNPDGARAWELVDRAGCRGLTLGGAQVSEKHTNFLINTGDATSADIEALGEEVRRRVKEQSGVSLEWEIKRVGAWRQVMNILPGDNDEPGFSFSIGFPVSVGQPEAVIFGLSSELRHSMMNEIRRQCSDGLKLSDGLRISGLIEGFDCVARRITDPEAIRQHFGWAIWYHRSQLGKEMTEAYQIVWPGAQQGLFPWETGCHPDVIALQPALYETSIH